MAFIGLCRGIREAHSKILTFHSTQNQENQKKVLLYCQSGGVGNYFLHIQLTEEFRLIYLIRHMIFFLMIFSTIQLMVLQEHPNFSVIIFCIMKILPYFQYFPYSWYPMLQLFIIFYHSYHLQFLFFLSFRFRQNYLWVMIIFDYLVPHYLKIS